MRISTMSWHRSYLCAPFTAAVTVLTILGCNNALAAVSNIPLSVSQVKPNIIMAVDDSGSMDGEMLFSTNDGAAWWRTSAGGGCPLGFVGCGTTGSADTPETGRPNFNHAGTAGNTWKKYTYLFPTGTGTGNRIYSDGSNDHFAVPPLQQFAWTRSPDFNAAYFDPTETYTAWQSYGSTTFANASPSAARTDPVLGSTTFDLTRNRMSGTSVADSAACSGTSPSLSTDHQFRMYPGMVIPLGTCYRVDGGSGWGIAPSNLTIGTHTSHDPANLRTTATGSGLGVAIRYFPATFYLASSALLPADYGYSATPLSGTGPNGESLVGYEIKSSNFSSTAKYQAAIQNFANWWTYYRKRHAATRGGIGVAFSDTKAARVGTFTINNRIDVTMRDMDVISDRNTFYSTIYNYVGSGGTPNREAVVHMGSQFNRTGSGAPITYACQKNFGILFTDGYSNASTPTTVGNIDEDMGSPFADAVSNTMADYATNYYLNRLRADLSAGQVSVDDACDAANPDPWLDCNTDLHMSFYAVTLGSKGLIYDVNTAQTQDPFANPPTWPTSFQDRHPSAVDDLWHATINTRGEMLNAKTPKEVGDKLGAVLRSIVERLGSSSALASNSTRLETDTVTFQAQYHSGTWRGELNAYTVASDGSLSSSPWTDGKGAGQLLNDVSPSNRNIYVYNPQGSNANDRYDPFTWTNLGSTQRTALGSTTTEQQNVVSYLRGERSQERSQTGGTFRTRTGVLGDIVNSTPLYVGAPNAQLYANSNFTGASSYGTFVNNHSGTNERTPVVYVGANDGMLHAFNADTGAEIYAFVPNTVILNGLKQYSDPTYSHRYFVDGEVAAADIYDTGDNDWKTVLVGTLGRGGPGVFALDVTNPPTTATQDSFEFLWEKNGSDISALGKNIGKPVIAQVADGDWRVLIGNGPESSSGSAQLIMIRLRDGNVTVVDTGATGNNGLTAVLARDSDGDGFSDTAYAGDLQGNLWKFTNLSGSPSATKLFKALDSDGNAQPITAAPLAGKDPATGQLWVFFGTGRYLSESDLSDQQIQTWYGIKDTGTSISGRANLVERSILDEGEIAGIDVRVIEEGTVAELQSKQGWYIDLVSPDNGAEGERIVVPNKFQGSTLIGTTRIPDASDPCNPGGRGFEMAINPFTGARLATTYFDVNSDGVFNSQDMLNGVPVSGIGFDSSPSSPIFIENFMQVGLEDGSIKTIKTQGSAVESKRMSWRELVN